MMILTIIKLLEIHWLVSLSQSKLEHSCDVFTLRIKFKEYRVLFEFVVNYCYESTNAYDTRAELTLDQKEINLYIQK
jgi:hypothetical protein